VPAIAVIRIKLIFKKLKVIVKKFKVKFFFELFKLLILIGLDTLVIKEMSRLKIFLLAV